MFKSLWPILSLARPIPRRPLSILSESGPVRIQHVRIRKPFWNRKHSLLFLGTATLLGYYGLDITVEEENDEEDEGRQKKKPSKQSNVAPSNVLAKAANKDKAEDSEDAIFIPLGFKHERPQILYQETDPEYQSYVDFYRDGRKVRSVQVEMALTVCRAISVTAPFPQVLGTPIKLRHWWIEFRTPRGPPPEYEQSGIEITDEDIAWTTRPISAKQYSRIQVMFQPRSILLATWASWSTFWSSRWARIQEMITFGSKPEDLNNGSPSISLNLQKLIKVHPNEDTQANSDMKNPLPEPNKDHSQDEQTEHQPQVPSNSEKSSDSDDLAPMRQDVHAALEAFGRTLTRNWKKAEIVPERGTLVAMGLVQVVGPRGTCDLEVTALYHPQESRFKSPFTIRLNGWRKFSDPKGGL